MDTLKDKKRTFDYTWVVVALCFLMVFTALGFCSSTKGLFIKPVTDVLGIKRSTFSLNDSCRYISTAVVNIFFGILVAKFGAKKLIGAGFLSLMLSMVIYATAENIYMFCLGGCLLGVGLSWTTTTMVGCVVNKWCSENKGTVMGAVLASNGLGGALAMQIVTPVIMSGPFGYRKAYMLIAGILLFVGVLMIVFFREKPKHHRGGGPIIHKKRARGESWQGIEYSQAVKKPYFYSALICIFLTGCTLQGVTGVSVAHMQDIGMDAGFVAGALSMHSLALAGFKFLTGFIYDKRGLRTTVNICSITAVSVMLMLAFMTNSSEGRIAAVLYSVFSALALPLETIMLPIYASDLFGERAFDKVLGLFVSVNTAGYAIGAPLMNLCYDFAGSYKLAFIICGMLMLTVTVWMQFVISAAHRQRKKKECAEKL